MFRVARTRVHAPQGTEGAEEGFLHRVGSVRLRAQQAVGDAIGGLLVRRKQAPKGFFVTRERRRG